jgi:hypothetical protein
MELWKANGGLEAGAKAETPGPPLRSGPACGGPDLSGYELMRELAPGRTWLARDGRGEVVVLKRLDPDCLRRGRLHVAIQDRLARVRELAHVGVAQLLAVERDGEDGWMVWEWVEGVTLEEYAQRAQGSAFRVQEEDAEGAGICPETGDGRSEMGEEMLRVLREVTRAVQTLHVQGIVHGRIHGRNVIVCPDGSVRLTHLSELLFTEAGDDVAAVVGMLRGMGLAMGDRRLETGDGRSDIGNGGWGMREVRQWLMELGEDSRVRGSGFGVQDEQEDERGRRWAWWGAGVVAVGSVVFAVGVGWYVGREEWRGGEGDPDRRLAAPGSGPAWGEGDVVPEEGS